VRCGSTASGLLELRVRIPRRPSISVYVNVVCCQRSLRRADPSSTGVLPNVDVIECDQVPH
jgi:hypothetical protein